MTCKYPFGSLLYFLYNDSIHYAHPVSILIKEKGVFYKFGNEVDIEKQQDDVFDTAEGLLEKLRSAPQTNFDELQYPF